MESLLTPIEDLNNRFTYVPDEEQHEDRPAWFILKDEGEVKGDCEDYALTLAWLESDKSCLKLFWNFVKGRFQMWSGLAGENRHAVLYDKEKEKWADNIWRQWVDELGDGYSIDKRRSVFDIYRHLLRSWFANR